MNLDEGTATLAVADQDVRDFFKLTNALSNGHSVAATVSYTIHWHGVKRRRQVHNQALHVEGPFVDTGATIHWTGRNASGFSFTSEAEGQKVISAQIGHERNGVFFD